MVVEHFKNGDAVPVYRRFREQGRLAPPGLNYISSWVTSDLTRCFQIMESPDRAYSISGSLSGRISWISRSFRSSPRQRRQRLSRLGCDSNVAVTGVKADGPRRSCCSGNRFHSSCSSPSARGSGVVAQPDQRMKPAAFVSCGIIQGVRAPRLSAKHRPHTRHPRRLICRILIQLSASQARGPSVVCIHSNASSSAQWRSLMNLLSPTHRVLAPDCLWLRQEPGVAFGPNDSPRRRS